MIRNFSDLVIQRNSQKIQRKILKVSILNIFMNQSAKMLLNDIWLRSWGPDGSFDTHIVIFINDIYPMPYMSIMSFLSFMTLMTSLMSYMNMSIWVSKEPSGPQDCSQMSFINILEDQVTEIVEILTFNISLCIFWKFLCITKSLKLRIKMASNQFVPLAKCF